MVFLRTVGIPRTKRTATAILISGSYRGLAPFIPAVFAFFFCVVVLIVRKLRIALPDGGRRIGPRRRHPTFFRFSLVCAS